MVVDEEETEDQRCVECEKPISLGVNCIAAQDGVMGPNGFVDLEDPIYFCSETCLRKYFNDIESPKFPRRVP